MTPRFRSAWFLAFLITLVWRTGTPFADPPPPKVVMLIPASQRATLSPYVTSVRLYLRDLEVALITRSIDTPADVDLAAPLAREEKARLVFWSSPSVSAVSFYYPDHPGSPVERRPLGAGVGEEGSIEAFSLVVHGAVSAVLEGRTGSYTPPGNDAVHTPEGTRHVSEDNGIQPPDQPVFGTVPSLDGSVAPSFVAGEKEAADATEDKGAGETDSRDAEESDITDEIDDASPEDVMPPSDLSITIHPKSVAHIRDRLLLDLGYRLTVFGTAPSLVHGVDIMASVRLSSMFALFLGYGITVKSRIEEGVSFDIRRYPVLLGGQLWVRRSRIETGGLVTVAIGYVKPEVRAAPPSLGWVDTEGHTALSAAIQAAVRFNLWERLWAFAALGAEIPILYREYEYVDESGALHPLTDSWPVRPLFCVGLSLVLY